MKTFSFEKKGKMKLVTFLTALFLVAMAFFCFSLTTERKEVKASYTDPSPMGGVIDLDNIFVAGDAYNTYYKNEGNTVALSYENSMFNYYGQTVGASKGVEAVTCNRAFSNGVQFSFIYHNSNTDLHAFFILRYGYTGAGVVRPWNSGVTGYFMLAEANGLRLYRCDGVSDWNANPLGSLIPVNIFDHRIHNIKYYVNSETASSLEIKFELDGTTYTINDGSTPFAAAGTNFVICPFSNKPEIVHYTVAGYGTIDKTMKSLTPGDIAGDAGNITIGNPDARDGRVTTSPAYDEDVLIGKHICYNNSTANKNGFDCLYKVGFVDKYNYDLDSAGVYDFAFGLYTSGAGAIWDYSGYFLYIGSTKGASTTNVRVYEITPAALDPIAAKTKTIDDYAIMSHTLTGNLLDGDFHSISFHAVKSGNIKVVMISVDDFANSTVRWQDASDESSYIGGDYMTLCSQNSIQDVDIVDTNRTYAKFGSCGTAIRTASVYSGLRFGTTISNSYYSELVTAKSAGTIKSFTMGTLIIPTAALAGASLTESTPSVLNIERTVWFAEGSSTNTFIGTVSQVPKDYFNTSFTSRAYIKIVNSDDSVDYVYSEHVETSVVTVALKLLQQAKDAYDGGETSNPYTYGGVNYATVRYTARQLKAFVTIAGL